MRKDAPTHRRTDAQRVARRAVPTRLRTWIFALTVRLCVGAWVPSVLHGQVGHDPERSPFRDVTARQAFTVSIGRFAGSRTVAGVGARPGLAVGLRLDARLSGPVDLWVSAARVTSSRKAVDTTKDTLSRVSGPVDMPLILADVGLVLNLTGPKSWRGLAPYAGLGAGFVAATDPRVDPGGYRAGSNFAFIPSVGTRFYVGRSLAVRVEARDYYFRYEWPSRYFQPNATDDNPVPLLDGSVSSTQWTHNVTLSAGVAFTFNF